MAKSCCHVHLSLEELEVVMRNYLVVYSLHSNPDASELSHSDCSPAPYSQFRSSQLNLLSPDYPVSRACLQEIFTLPQLLCCLSKDLSKPCTCICLSPALLLASRTCVCNSPALLLEAPALLLASCTCVCNSPALV